MADIQITDDLGAPIPGVTIDLKQPSSLLKYAKSELLQLLVVTDFTERAPKPLSTVAANPISFQLTLKHKFQLGNTKPEIELTPKLQATIRANTTKDSNLFENDPFRVPSRVSEGTGYVSVALQGALNLGVSGTAGDLTFGFGIATAMGIEYWKAFPLGAGEPTLGEATARTISGYVIPAALDDLKLLGVNDVCTVSGQGSLTVSGGFNVSAVPNPLASVDLPLRFGKIDVKAGVMTGISASFTIRGSYQFRARRTSTDAIELGFYKQHGTTFVTDLSASAGVSMNSGEADLLKSLLGAISSNPNDKATMRLFAEGGLTEGEIATLTGAIKGGLDHSLRGSLDLALSQLADDEAAFQYEIRPADLDATAIAALHRALAGNLSGLTALESESGGTDLAPGVKLMSSVLTAVRKEQAVLKLNLLGLVNFVSITDLIRKCVVVTDPDTGYLTIADSATGKQINAHVENLHRNEALRKAMFESMVLTATYRASSVVTMAGLASHNFHFAFNANTKKPALADYLGWFVTLNLLTKEQAGDYLKSFAGRGHSTCLLRTEFDDNACQSLFFESPGKLWGGDHYLEIGRQAMRALIDRDNSDVDRYRYDLLDQHWKEAQKIGAAQDLGLLVGLHPTNPTQAAITNFLIGDVFTITWWDRTMRRAGEAILEMQKYLSGSNPVTSGDSHEFANRRNDLQKKMAGVIKESKTRFDEPWGFISLFWAAGSKGGSAKLVAEGLQVQKP